MRYPVAWPGAPTNRMRVRSVRSEATGHGGDCGKVQDTGPI